MSSILDALGVGGPPPDGGPSAGPPGGGGQPGPDTPQVEDAVRKAIDAVQEGLDGENDPGDKAFLADIIAKLHKFLGDQQKMVDTAIGAGPGVKLLRKAQGGGGGAPPPGGPGY